MRIAYVCSDPGISLDGHKGAAVHVREMTRAMASLGHDVRVYTARDGDGGKVVGLSAIALLPDAADVELIELISRDATVTKELQSALRSVLSAASFRHGLRAALRSWRPDLVYERYSLFGTTGSTVAGELAVPHVLEVNAPLADEHAHHRGLALVETAHALERVVASRAGMIVAVSTGIRDWLVGLGIDSDRIVVLTNAVDPQLFAPDPAAGAAARAQLGVDGGPVVGFVGSLRPWHDLGALLEAFGQVVTRVPGASLVVVGDGPRRHELELAAEGLGIASRCRFTGAVAYADVPRYLAAMDLTVAPYAAADSFYFSPLKVVESLAAGVPVLAAAAGDIGCCVVPGRTGWTYHAGDRESLATTLETACRSTDRGVLGEAGRMHVVERHTWRRSAAQILGTFAARGDTSEAGRASEAVA